MNAVTLLAGERVVELVREHERGDDGGARQRHLAGQPERGRVARERVRERGGERRLVILGGVVPQLARARIRGFAHLGPHAPRARLVLAAYGHGEEYAEEIARVGAGAVVEAALIGPDDGVHVTFFGRKREIRIGVRVARIHFAQVVLAPTRAASDLVHGDSPCSRPTAIDDGAVDLLSPEDATGTTRCPDENPARLR